MDAYKCRLQWGRSSKIRQVAHSQLVNGGWYSFTSFLRLNLQKYMTVIISRYISLSRCVLSHDHPHSKAVSGITVTDPGNRSRWRRIKYYRWPLVTKSFHIKPRKPIPSSLSIWIDSEVWGKRHIALNFCSWLTLPGLISKSAGGHQIILCCHNHRSITRELLPQVTMR